VKAKVEEPEIKYYGTEISLTLDNGKEASIVVWVHDGSCQASKRVLEGLGCETNDEAFGEDGICDNHYESQICYDICERIAKALNNWSPSSNPTNDTL
jgi:hypothetical protein